MKMKSRNWSIHWSQTHLDKFGLRKLHSTYMALMTLTEKLTKYLDDDEYVIGFFLDFSKAFDTEDHVILLQQLSGYGVRWNAMSLFESYLKDRRQFVTYNGYLLILKCCNVEFFMFPFLTTSPLNLYKWSCQRLHFIFPYTVCRWHQSL